MTTRARLFCGAVAGPLFLLVVLIQDYTRPGFDPRVHALSLLSLGRWGWIQILNFVVAGALDVLYARGLRRRVAGRVGSIIAGSIGVYGLALIVVGVFPTDPSNGFPPGSIALPEPSWHGLIHGLGALFVFVPLAASLVLFARWFSRRRERGWAAYTGASAVLMVALFFGGVSGPLRLARMLRLATLIGWMAPAMCAIRLIQDSTRSTDGLRSSGSSRSAMPATRTVAMAPASTTSGPARTPF
jgi:hypothetical protein